MTADALLRFLRSWMLAFAIALGVLLYFGWMALPFGATYEEEAISVVKFVQPWLIFTMLFVTFCKIDPRHLRLRRWHARHLAFQALTFTALAVLLHYFPTWSGRPVIEGAMLCLICPTATSCAVITGKLGGDIEGVTTYTMLINLLAALLIPAVVLGRMGGAPLAAARAPKAAATQGLRVLPLGRVSDTGHHLFNSRLGAHRRLLVGALRHRVGCPHHLHRAICPRTPRRAAHRRTDCAGTGLGTKEYGLRHLGGLHVF